MDIEFEKRDEHPIKMINLLHLSRVTGVDYRILTECVKNKSSERLSMLARLEIYEAATASFESFRKFLEI